MTFITLIGDGDYSLWFNPATKMVHTYRESPAVHIALRLRASANVIIKAMQGLTSINTGVTP